VTRGLIGMMILFGFRLRRENIGFFLVQRWGFTVMLPSYFYSFICAGCLSLSRDPLSHPTQVI